MYRFVLGINDDRIADWLTENIGDTVDAARNLMRLPDIWKVDIEIRDPDTDDMIVVLPVWERDSD